MFLTNYKPSYCNVSNKKYNEIFNEIEDQNNKQYFNKYIIDIKLNDIAKVNYVALINSLYTYISENYKCNVIGLNDINDIYYSTNYKYYLDCLLFIPFVNIYRCYVNIDKNDTTLYVLGIGKITLKQNDFIIFDYCKDFYTFTDKNKTKLLRLHFIGYSTNYLYRYCDIMKSLIYFYEKCYLNKLFNYYYDENEYDINKKANISTDMLLLNTLSIFDLIFGLRNIIIYKLIYLSDTLKKFYIYIFIISIIKNINDLNKKKINKFYPIRNLLFDYVLYYATSYSTLSLA